ncbi:MAG: methyltransferase [Actinomycetota bacterium]|nr:methyltransferase [Actinomycetota bacterium]MDQ3901560.1 methyltransferase [Actinomycetota bacterium]
MITHQQLPEYYDWLSRYVQLTNWLAYRDRFASFTMHKRLGIEPAQHAGGRRTAGVEYVNDRVLAVADLPPEPQVLDAGCGFGGTIFHWQPRIGGRYEGITLSAVQLAVAQREAHRRGIADVCRFRLRSYDEPPGSGFDAVVAIESLIHSPNLHRTLSNLSGALQPGGVLLLLDDMAVRDLDRHRPAEADLLRRHWGCARSWTYDDYRNALDDADLSLRHEEDLSTLMRPRREEILDRLERTYYFLHHNIPLRPARTVVSAYLGGIALERLHASGDVHYRLLVAGKGYK